MNPFRKRSKSAPGAEGKARRERGRGALPGSPQVISTADLAFSLPSENNFRTSLLLPTMADRFSLLRIDELGQNKSNGHELEPSDLDHPDLEHPNQHSGMYVTDLSVLEEGDENEEDLPVHPWERQQKDSRNGSRESPVMREGMSKDEFIRVRAQEGGNTTFSGKQRTFKFRSDDGNCMRTFEELANAFRHRSTVFNFVDVFKIAAQPRF
jgi:hypothetical protein